MKISILTLFPEMLEPMLRTSILGRAIKAGYIDVQLVNIRDYADNRHSNTDDYPFGGGAGMVMMPQPIVDAVAAVSKPGVHRIYMSPRGRRLDQSIVEELSGYDSLLFLCGHYEGVDQRALDSCIDEELSIGDYVLTGGELGALVTIDAVSRLIPGVLGSEESSEDESFTTGLLEYPQYTRPAVFRGQSVPDVLLGGNHADIVAWRREESLKITRQRRSEMLSTAPLDDTDRDRLNKMQVAEDQIRILAEQGMHASRMEYFAERGYAKAWFAAMIPPERRNEAKHRLFSGRRHIGFLSQAFEQGYMNAREIIPATFTGNAVLYLEKTGVALEITLNDTLPPLQPRTLLTDTEMKRTWVCEGNGTVRYFEKSETSV